MAFSSVVLIDKASRSRGAKNVPGTRAFAALDAKEIEVTSPLEAPLIPSVPGQILAPPPPPVVTERPADSPEPALAVLPQVVVPPAPPPPATPPQGLDVYRGMGTWVDIYDYAIRDVMDIPAAVQSMAERGVRTLYLQTGRWKDPQDIVSPAGVDLFLDSASKHGINVVAWYVPGFGNIDRDIRRSVIATQYKTPAGNRFAGFAPDIETKEEVGMNTPRFNAGVAEYSRRLREALPNAVLGAIVLDAKNNLRAPAAWGSFPWPEIGKNYDVILPMAYWSVTKRRACGTQYNALEYVKDVAALTEKLMGVRRPFHMIGGIADCITADEVAGFVRGSKEVAIGGSLYDYPTIQSSTVKIWNSLTPLND